MFASNPFAELLKLDDNDWHCFTLSQYDRNTGEWELQKSLVYHIVD